MSRRGCAGWLAVALAIVAAEPAGAVEKADKPKESSGPFQYDSKGRRDPFSPLVRDGRLVAAGAVRIEASKPMLYGILWDPGGKSIALINDIEAKVGDTVGGYQVREIRKDAVILDSGSEEPLVLQIAFDAPSKLSPGTTKGGDVQ